MEKQLIELDKTNPLSSFEQAIAHLQKSYLLNENLAIEDASLFKSEFLIKESSDLIKVRFIELEKFVYEKDIKISYKIQSVLSALHSCQTTFLVKIVSDGIECKIYLGIKDDNPTNSLKILEGALIGNFPGTRYSRKEADSVIQINKETFNKEEITEISAVVGIPSIKDKEEEHFVQGLENLIIGMNGKPFSAIFIAEAISSEEVKQALDVYETIYSVYSAEKEFVVNEGTNKSSSESRSLTQSENTSTSSSSTKGSSRSYSKNKSPWIGRKLSNHIFGTDTAKIVSGVGDIVLSSLSSFYMLHTAKKIANGVNIFNDNKSEGQKTTSTNESNTKSTTKGTSTSESVSKSISEGSSSSIQKTYTNKKVENTLKDLEQQIERLKSGMGIGFWNVGAYFLSAEEQNSLIAANIYNGIIKGDESNFESSGIKTFKKKIERDNLLDYLQSYEIPYIAEEGRQLAQAINTKELTVQIGLPNKSIIGLDVVETIPFGNNPLKINNSSLKIGNLYNYEKEFQQKIALDYNKFTSHIFVTGSTGSGKSNVTYNLLDKLLAQNIKFLVLEPAKGEYKHVFGGLKNVAVYGTNEKETALLKINPFEFPDSIHIIEHIDRFIEIINSCWSMEAAMPAILKEAIEETYIQKGWLLESSEYLGYKKTFPTFEDLLTILPEVIGQSNYSAEVKGNYVGALVSRVKSLTNGFYGQIFSNESISDSKLFDENVIIDLSRVPSLESKALLMGVVFMKLNEYRIANASGSNSALKHVTVLEEAHNLLKRTSSEQSSDSSNLVGKSVEMMSNAIAEMRTYGEGFIIADQSPGLLDMSVIRNTNTKICLRLPDLSDRELVGKSMNLNDEQINYLSKLETGVAAIYQNDWQEAILCKFEKFDEDLKPVYSYNNEEYNVINISLSILKKYKDKPKLLPKVYHNYAEKHLGINSIIKEFNEYLKLKKLRIKTVNINSYNPEIRKIIISKLGVNSEDSHLIFNHIKKRYNGN